MLYSWLSRVLCCFSRALPIIKTNGRARPARRHRQDDKPVSSWNWSHARQSLSGAAAIPSLCAAYSCMYSISLAVARIERSNFFAVYSETERFAAIGRLNAMSAAATLLTQVFLGTHRVSQMLSIPLVLASVPCLHCILMLLLFFEPSMATAGMYTIVMKTLNFGFAKPLRELCWTRVPNGATKYAWKGFNDGWMRRAGDILSSLLHV